ncbi:MAG: tryptophan synthase subunit alpha, partial [Gammaproteobacteria bacterium]
MSRISATFQRLAASGRKALIPFVTAGYPQRERMPDILRALARNGSDVIELGVPFSDPMADGPVIQASSQHAIEHGMNLGGT